MIIGPRYRFDVDASGASAAARIQLCNLGDVVPGVSIVCFAPGWSHGYFVTKVEPQHQIHVTGFRLTVQLHGAYLITGVLQTLGVPFTVTALEPPPEIIDYRARAADLLAQGRAQMARLASAGEVRTWVEHFALPHQLRCLGWNTTRPYWANVIPCGGGKTLVAILAMLSIPGPVIILGPSHCRRAWANQIPLYADVDVHVLQAASTRRAGDETLQAYLQRCHRGRHRPIVVAGVEVLGDYLKELCEVRPTTMLIDEVHLLGSTQRWSYQALQDGNTAFAPRETAASGQVRPDGRVNKTRVTAAYAAYEISRLRSLRMRGGLSATPMADGRPRRIFGPLDLLTAGGFGTYGSDFRRGFSDRYCGITKNALGYRVDKGESNLTELAARMCFFSIEVPYAESHAHVKLADVEYVYLEPRELGKATADDTAEMAAAERRWGRAADGSEGAVLLAEVRKDVACRRKAPFVLAEAAAAARSGQRVCILVSRKAVADAWAQALRDDFKGVIPVWSIHSDMHDAVYDRDTALDAYMAAPSGAVIVATGQSLGVSIDGLQATHLGIIAMLPNGPDELIQWRGRFERHGGIGTRLLIVVAAGTADEGEASRLVDKIENVRVIQEARELDGADRGLLGMQDTGLIDRRILAKLGFTGSWAEEALVSSGAGLDLTTAWGTGE